MDSNSLRMFQNCQIKIKGFCCCINFMDIWPLYMFSSRRSFAPCGLCYTRIQEQKALDLGFISIYKVRSFNAKKKKSYRFIISKNLSEDSFLKPEWTKWGNLADLRKQCFMFTLYNLSTNRCIPLRCKER